MPELDFDAAYRVENYGGIAWRINKYVEIRDEDYEWTGIAKVDESRVEMHMIGDDTSFTFEVIELTVLDEDDYCSVCGQIGCRHNF